MKKTSLDEWPDWIDSYDVTTKMRISPRTLQRWRISGMIPYSRVNGKCYYRKSDIIHLLNKNINNKRGGQR